MRIVEREWNVGSSSSSLIIERLMFISFDEHLNPRWNEWPLFLPLMSPFLGRSPPYIFFLLKERKRERERLKIEKQVTNDYILFDMIFLATVYYHTKK